MNSMKVKPDIILTTDVPATYSLLACKHAFVKAVPIVFMSVNFPNWELLKQYPNTTGIWDKELNYMIEEYLQHPDSLNILRAECAIYFGEGEELTTELKSTQFYFQNLRDEVGAIYYSTSMVCGKYIH